MGAKIVVTDTETGLQVEFHCNDFVGAVKIDQLLKERTDYGKAKYVHTIETTDDRDTSEDI